MIRVIISLLLLLSTNVSVASLVDHPELTGSVSVFFFLALAVFVVVFSFKSGYSKTGIVICFLLSAFIGIKTLIKANIEAHVPFCMLQGTALLLFVLLFQIVDMKLKKEKALQ